MTWSKACEAYAITALSLAAALIAFGGYQAAAVLAATGFLMLRAS